MAGLQARHRRRGGASSPYRTTTGAAALLVTALRKAGATAFACTRSGATCNALGDLYASASGAGWELPNVAGVGVPPQAWAAAASGVATDYCTFEGVVCDSANNVVSLALRGSALQGVLPSSLGQITTLAYIDLGANFLSGQLPSSLANLAVLTTLLLDDNLLTGTLPAGVTQLPRLTTLNVDNNRLNGSAVSGAQCSSAAVCASTEAFTASTCPLAGCGGGCAPTCRASCAVTASPGVDVAAVVAGCNDTIAAASCNDCTVAMVNSLMRSGVALPDNNAFGRCLLDPMPQFIAASASPSVLSAALHNCAFTRRLFSNATCAATVSVADFQRAVAPCASPGSACNTCSASLVDVLIRGGLPVAPLGLQFTTAHFELVSNCLARNVLKILQANVSSVTLLRGFAYCTGPSPGWYAAVQNATRAAAMAAFSPSNKSRSNAVVGAVVGATGGAAVVGAFAFIVLRRRARRLSAPSSRLKDASASASIMSGSSGDASKQSRSSSMLGTMKPMLLGEELVVGDLIGSGGYARVHRAAWNGTQVAVKCFEPLPWLNPMNLNRWESGPSFGLNANNDSRTDSRSLLGGSSTDSQDKLGSLMQELQLLQSLRHPNICAVYGLVLRPPMLVIELATAGSLAALLKRSSLTSLQWHSRVSIATGVAAGVEFLHAQDPPLIHRDLKSANVVLSDTLVPKLCDFGLSRVLPVLASTVTQAGTPQYMAPEVARGLPILRPTAIDAYGLGVVLHDLTHVGVVEQPAAGGGVLSGSTGGAPMAHVLYKRANTDFATTIGAHVPPPLAALASSCLAVDPAARPESSAVRAQLLLLLPASHGWA